MGYGSFNYTTYATTSRFLTKNADGTDKAVHEVFRQRSIHASLDPKKIVVRESCDSDDSPESVPIIVALDVTGSMGHIAQSMVSTQLGTLMEGIWDNKVIKYPHLMFMAVGDVEYDDYPLQVSQFEADVSIVQQLSNIYVEGGGGGNNTESYDLPWYFAATKTKIDSFDKRGKKGYLFTIGDEMPPSGVKKVHLKETFGAEQEVNYSPEALLKMAQEKYNVFHVLVEEGSYARKKLDTVVPAWKELLGKRTLCLKDYTKLSEVISAAIRVSEGEDPETVIESYQGTKTKSVIRHAFSV